MGILTFNAKKMANYTDLKEYKDFRLSAEQALGAISDKWLLERFPSWRLCKTWNDYKEWLRYFKLEDCTHIFTPKNLR